MDSLAARLWAARQSGTVIAPGDIVEPASNEEAYAVQAEIVALSGLDVKGFKVGSTSAEAQRILGTDEPGSGAIFAPYLHESPARVTLSAAHMPAIEGEFGFRLGRDLAPREEPYGYEDMQPAIEAVAGSVEVVGTRIEGGLAGKGRFLVTADGGANIALITGAWQTDWKGIDLKAHRVAVHINGQPGDAVDQGRLSGAGRADDADDLAFGNVEINRVEGDEAAVALGQRLNGNDGRSRRHRYDLMRFSSRPTNNTSGQRHAM